MTVNIFRTLSAPTTGEFKNKGSRFLAYGYPLSHIDQLKEYLNPLKKQHNKAVHFCYAYRLGTTGVDFRANDDGEPSGSAGRPILGQIDSFGLTNCVVIVVRYFGGTLLGIPGLIQAYKQVTAQALNQAIIIEKDVTQTVQIQCTYAQLREVLYIAKQHQADTLLQDLQIECKLQFAVPLNQLEHARNIWKSLQLINYQEL